MSIVAIGGGNREPAIRAALNQSSTEHNQVLIIPTACSLPSSYSNKVSATTQFFANTMGLPAHVLHEYGETPSVDHIEHELGKASLIYTIGGNTPYLFEKMAQSGLDKALAATLRADTAIHAGVSAGALLPFELIHTNPSARPEKEIWDFAQLPGLGVLRGIAAAHADAHDKTPIGPRADSRLDNLLAHFPADHALGLAIENGAGVIIGNEPRVVTATPGAHVHLIENHNDRLRSHTVEDPTELRQFIR